MKISSIIFLILFCLKLNAEVIPDEIDPYERDSVGKLKNVPKPLTKETSEKYFIAALHSIRTQKVDSLKTAYSMLSKLHYFDSSIYSSARLNNYFAQIETGLLSYYKKTIIGNWTFEWSGSNWGTSKTSANKKASLVFTDTECYFYISDTLQRKTKYVITNEFVFPYPKPVFFQLYFLDNKDLWNFSFRTSGENYTAKLKYNEENIGLFINEMPNCLCGCPERIYLKNSAENYRIGKLQIQKNLCKSDKSVSKKINKI
jgi:hypothetical protein